MKNSHYLNLFSFLLYSPHSIYEQQDLFALRKNMQGPSHYKELDLNNKATSLMRFYPKIEP